MIVEYLTESGRWACSHEAAGAGGFTYEEPDLMGGERLREAAVCRLCGVWFTLEDRAAGSLFDSINEETTNDYDTRHDDDG